MVLPCHSTLSFQVLTFSLITGSYYECLLPLCNHLLGLELIGGFAELLIIDIIHGIEIPDNYENL